MVVPSAPRLAERREACKPDPDSGRCGMKTVRKYFWPFISAVLALLAIFATYNVFFMGRPKKALEIIVDPPVSLVDIRPEAAKDIEVLYRGESVSNISLLQISIKNPGNEPITEADYSRPLTFSFAPTYVVADVAVSASHPPNIGLVITQTSEYQAEAAPSLLNPDDVVTVRFIVIGPGGESVLEDFEIDARIVGVREIDVVSSSQQPASQLSMLISPVTAGIVGITLALLFTITGERGAPRAAGARVIRLVRRLWEQADSSGGLVIHTASYGTEEKMNDVTEILKSKVKDQKLELLVANDNLGGDPAYAEAKALRVEYTYAGERHSVTADERETLSLP